SALPYIIDNSFPTPCYQCVVMENGKISICGRCIDVDGLCEKCGYFFVAEYTLAFQGNVKIIAEMLCTYLKYV
ncbi:MAG: metallo cofactor biosynthesis protein, partial [Clostridia bacterium]|nr:metallo cofactor biosynthesis protein [Clostridia bacterium]